jgi:uncharacterized damage-inducible protein DinB
MSLEPIRGLYDYHRWANRRLFDVAVERGEAAVTRDMGPQWSCPTVLRMFGHIYGADAVWLARWRGAPLAGMPGGDIPTMRELRATWDAFEADQRRYIEALSDADLQRVLEYKNLAGQTQRAPLRMLIHHVVNHATHHRSEISTMLTMIGGSPPDTGINSYLLVAGQA